MKFLVGTEGKLPTRGSPEAAGLDLYASHDVEIPGWSVATVSLDIACEMPPGFVGIIKDRSSLAKRGIHVLGGVIDSDYRGEWKVVLQNSGYGSFRVEHGDRIAQVIFLPYYCGNPIEVERLGESERGTGGFGSTGK